MMLMGLMKDVLEIALALAGVGVLGFCFGVGFAKGNRFGGK